MLAIKRYVIHEMTKKSGDTLVTPEFSNSIPPIDTFSEKLIEETHKSFSSSTSLKNTKFEDGHSTVFLTGLTKYLSKDDDTSFYDFTIKSLNDLKIKLTKQQFATGGYYLFADYEFENRRFISVVLLRKKEGINFVFVQGIFKPVDVDTLNIEKIAMGVRLNHGIYKSEDEDKSYLALVSNQQEKFSEYFKEWVQAAHIISNDKNTNTLVTILDSIDIPLDDNDQPKYISREEMKKAFFDLIEQGPDKMVNLHLISEHFYGEEKRQYLLDYAQQLELTIDPYFKRAPAILKRLITLKARVEGIELNVSLKKLNRKEVDVKEKMIVIHSKELADQVREQQQTTNNKQS